MIMKDKDYLAEFHELVSMKYQLYNSLFLTLPFENLADQGVKLPLFAEICREGLNQNKTPKDVIDLFFHDIMHTSDSKKKITILFLFLQLIERQVVLFDALEDAAFADTHDLLGTGTLPHFISRLIDENLIPKASQVLQQYRTRIVLTAHPTQFYPTPVLGIIQDLAEAISKGHLKSIHDLLLQLGKTPFQNTQKPTPLTEAESLLRYLEHVFYPAVQDIQCTISKTFHERFIDNTHFPEQIEMGFWPGGDRDGNPFVTTEITKQVTKKLKRKIVELYLKEIRSLMKRLTFKGMVERLIGIEGKLDNTWNKALQTSGSASNVSVKSTEIYHSSIELLNDLQSLRKILKAEHQSLFIEELDRVIITVRTFGFHFASLDIRQDSRILAASIEKILKLLITKKKLSEDLVEQGSWYTMLTPEEKRAILEKLLLMAPPHIMQWRDELDDITLDTLESLAAIPGIQQANGEKGLHNYIISNTHAEYNLLELILLVKWSEGHHEVIPLDIIPLFETIADLEQGNITMNKLYSHHLYRNHLKTRGDQQTVMLGFSDSAKDGGYMASNWMIFQAKQKIAEVSHKHGIRVVFFDGRGGPPARGGGNSHKFYRAIGDSFDQHEIHLTVQGQTISSNFGTYVSARYNIEQLCTAGLEHHLFPNAMNQLTEEDFKLLDELSTSSHKAYLALKNDPLFIPYLENMTPLKYYGQLNISSRPTKRKDSAQFRFEDLRAIPFVGAWSQIKQNIPGFYGLGTALQELVKRGNEPELKKLFNHCLFFRTIIENGMQSLCKSYFPLTHYISQDKEYGPFWNTIHKEAELTVDLLKRVSGQKELLDSDPSIQDSIRIRENLILPLLVIQQYAMMMLREIENSSDKGSEEDAIAYRKIILKSLAANTNASRNSA